MGGVSSETMAAWLVMYSLDNCGPARARWLASHPMGLPGALEDLRAGQVSRIEREWPRGLKPDLVDRWAGQVRQIEPAELLKRHLEIGRILCPDDQNWCFQDDPEPPLFLHAVGDAHLLGQRPSVGIVGTRRCSSVGRRFAAKLGAELAEAGVTVVSGLAKGVDGAAHAGTLSASGQAVAVVASGLDIVYPRSNEDLWNQIGQHGLLLTEAPLGIRPERWRFPARNRIIAALSDFVIVVESHEKGGALSTAEEASLRGISVGAVPGSVVSPASVGTNALLADGAIPVRHTQDALDALGIFLSLAQPTQAPLTQVKPAQPTLPGIDLVPKTQTAISHQAQQVMDELQAGSSHIDALLAATGLQITRLMALINQLAADGLVSVDGSTVIAVDQSLNPPFGPVRL